MLNWWLIKLKTEHWSSQRPTFPKRYFLSKFHIHHFFLFLVKHEAGTRFGNLSFKFVFSSTFWVRSICDIQFCYKHSFLHLKIVKKNTFMWSSLLSILVCNSPEFWTKTIIQFERRDTPRTLKIHIMFSESEKNKYKCSTRSL